MSLHELLPLIQMLFALVLAGITLRGNLKSRSHVLFSAFLFGIAIWGVIIYQMRSAPDLASAFRWERWTVALSPLLAILLVDFAVTDADFRRSKLIGLGYIGSLLWVPISFTNAVFTGMQSEPYGYAPVLGPFFFVWSVYCSALVIAAISVFIVSALRAQRPEDKNRAWYFLTGIGVAFLAGFFDILPLYGLASYPGLIIGILFFCTLTAYSILRHNLLDIRVILRKSLAFLVAGTTVTIPLIIIAHYLLRPYIVGSQAGIAGGAVTGLPTGYYALFVVLGLVVPPAWGVLNRLFDSWLHGARSRTYRQLSEVIRGDDIYDAHEEIGVRALELVINLVGARGGCLLEPVNHIYVSTVCDGLDHEVCATRFDDDHLFAKYLAKSGRICALSELEEIPQIQPAVHSLIKPLEDVGVSLIVPVRSVEGNGRSHLNAIMLLAEKRTGTMYRVEDFHELASVTTRLAAKLENLRLYRDAKRGRTNLENWFDSMSDSVVISGNDGVVRYANRNAREELGVRIGARFAAPSVVRRVAVKAADEGLSGYESFQVELAERNYDVAVVRLANYEDSEATLFVLRDITLLLQKEEEIAKAQRIESLGILAGGIAHDFNNLLTGVLGSLNIAETTPGLPPVAEEALRDAGTAVEGARGLTDQLLTFSRGGDPVFEPVDLVNLVSDTVRFALSGTQSRPSVHCTPDLYPALVDRGQMTQVISNLVINANQAMPDGGVVEIFCDNLAIEEGESPDLESGPYVRISVRDEGMGIPEDAIKKIFDPYYTTKKRGTGLGLAVVYSIVKKHRGHILVRSIPGEGTVFDLLLPAAAEIARGSKKVAGAFTPVTGRVLVMDDDDVVRKVLTLMLHRLGWEVTGVADGNGAIETYREALDNGMRFDIVIMDLTIVDGMGGAEAAKHLLKLDPEARLIVSSGYATDQTMSEYQDHGFCFALKKPFTLPSLEEALNTVFQDVAGRTE